MQVYQLTHPLWVLVVLQKNYAGCRSDIKSDLPAMPLKSKVEIKLK